MVVEWTVSFKKYLINLGICISLNLVLVITFLIEIVPNAYAYKFIEF